MAAVEDLINTLGQNVDTGLQHFQRLQAEGKLPPGIYGPRELLCKLTWWHQVAAEGIESVSDGGKPYQIYVSDDEIDLRAVRAIPAKQWSSCPKRSMIIRTTWAEIQAEAA